MKAAIEKAEFLKKLQSVVTGNAAGSRQAAIRARKSEAVEETAVELPIAKPLAQKGSHGSLMAELLLRSKGRRNEAQGLVELTTGTSDKNSAKHRDAVATVPVKTTSVAKEERCVSDDDLKAAFEELTLNWPDLAIQEQSEKSSSAQSLFVLPSQSLEMKSLQMSCTDNPTLPSQHSPTHGCTDKAHHNDSETRLAIQTRHQVPSQDVIVREAPIIAVLGHQEGPLSATGIVGQQILDRTEDATDAVEADTEKISNVIEEHNPECQEIGNTISCAAKASLTESTLTTEELLTVSSAIPPMSPALDDSPVAIASPNSLVVLSAGQPTGIQSVARNEIANAPECGDTQCMWRAECFRLCGDIWRLERWLERTLVQLDSATCSHEGLIRIQTSSTPFSKKWYAASSPRKLQVPAYVLRRFSHERTKPTKSTLKWLAMASWVLLLGALVVYLRHQQAIDQVVDALAYQYLRIRLKPVVIRRDIAMLWTTFLVGLALWGLIKVWKQPKETVVVLA